MKKALLAALFVTVISSWCLAQTDSLPVPTAEPCQPATCAGSCQAGACAVPCQSAPCAEPFVPKWAVGANISKLTNIPGTVFVERLCGKNILQLFLTANYRGEIQPDGKYFDSKVNDIRIDLGATGLKEIKGCGTHFKFYFGLSPDIFYVRNSHTSYSYGDSAYHDSYSTYYGTELTALLKASFVKDMIIKNARFRNELSVTPISGDVGIRYDKNCFEDFGGSVETSYYKIYYGLNLINTGSITYSIKYLF